MLPFRIATCLTVGLIVTACSKDRPKLEPISLAAGGVDAQMLAPVGATVSKDVIPGARIEAADGSFGLVVRVGDPKLDEAKERCTTAPKKNCEIEISEPDRLVTKWKQLGDYNYQLTMKVGTYTCKTLTSMTFEDQDDIDVMTEACRSLGQVSAKPVAPEAAQ